jgi:HEAT repeat protein
LQADLTQLVSESTARRFIEIIATENAEAKKNLKRRMRVRTLKRQPTQATDFNSFDEAWTHYKGQVLLLGASGAGKTTTLLHYAQTLVSRYLGDRNQPVPVFASIAFWDSYANTPLHEWLPEHNELPDDIRDVIQSGRAVLILDGLDELGREKPINPEKPEEGTFDPRRRFLEQVQTAIDDGNQILITCRVTDYEDIGEKLNIKGAIELQNLTDDQIDTYLGDVPTIQKTVIEDNDLLEICRSPLLLSLIAFGYRDATDGLKALPNMAEGDLRDAIFEQYITTSYDFEASRREMRGEEMPFTLEKTMDVLGHAAMINVCGGKRIDYEALSLDGTEIVENILVLLDFTHELEQDEIDNFLNFIEHMNVMEQHELDNYRFLHLLIRDYLAFTFSMRHFDEPTYYDFLTRSSPARAIGKLRDDRGVEFLIQLLQYSELPFVRESASTALGLIGDKRARQPLIYALHDASIDVSSASANALSELKDERIIEDLIYTLQHDKDSGVRILSARTLGEIANVRAIDSLIYALQHDESLYVRWSAAKALGKIADVRAIETLMYVLQHDQDKNVRLESARALGIIGDSSVILSLVKALNDVSRSGMFRVCDIAAKALEKIGTPEALQAVKEWRES